ncbi:hypothetical protein BKA70DRAFT_1482671 [Coprinopsis sp. MPI-PUGE-AT-0042]|nr:hypothetical protein BKA70DRAFT_1482671 [Coprinopsis sp. MPI-PUGE-AT-0042]
MEALSLQEFRSDVLLRKFDELLASRAQKREIVHASSSTLPSKFPPAVIASIATFALARPGSEGLMNQEDRLFFRHLLSVSHSWRTTLFSTPHLWTGITVGTSGWYRGRDAPNEDFVRRITSWFARAGANARLSLEVIPSPPKCTSESPIAFPDIITLLCSPSMNFVDLRIPVTGRFNFFDVLRDSECLVFPSVQRLTLRAHANDLRRPQNSIIDLTSSFPHLKSLHIIDTLSIKVAHTTVPELSFQRIEGGVGSLASLIGRFPALTSLRIEEDVPGKPWPEAVRAEPSIFPNVTRLFLSGTISPSFLADLSFPSLNLISIDDLPCFIDKPTAAEKSPWKIGSIHRERPGLMLAFRLMGMPPGIINLVLRSQPSKLTLHFGPGCAPRYVRLYTELTPYVRRIQIRELDELIPDDLHVRMGVRYGTSLRPQITRDISVTQLYWGNNGYLRVNKV